MPQLPVTLVGRISSQLDRLRREPDADGPRPADLSAGRSLWIDIDGPVHYVDYGGPEDGLVLVAVHGLGGSAINWDLISDTLTSEVRVLALDLPGHGRTAGLGRTTDVHANQRLVAEFIRRVVDRPVVVMGNSMGGLIAVLQATSNPAGTQGLVLVSPALPLVGVQLTDVRLLLEFLVIMTPGLGRLVLGTWGRFATAEMQVERMLHKVMHDPASLPEDALAAALAEARSRQHFKDTARDFVEATRSVISFTHTRQYARQLRQLRMPVLLLHGSQDKVVSVRSAVAAASRHPQWNLQVFHGVGHVPQIEVPDRTAEAIVQWLRAEGIGASSATEPAVDLRTEQGSGQTD